MAFYGLSVSADLDSVFWQGCTGVRESMWRKSVLWLQPTFSSGGVGFLLMHAGKYICLQKPFLAKRKKKYLIVQCKDK